MMTTTPAVRVSHSTILMLARLSFVTIPRISVGACRLVDGHPVVREKRVQLTGALRW
jgi:hypothetical protein